MDAYGVNARLLNLPWTIGRSTSGLGPLTSHARPAYTSSATTRTRLRAISAAMSRRCDSEKFEPVGLPGLVRITNAVLSSICSSSEARSTSQSWSGRRL